MLSTHISIRICQTNIVTITIITKFGAREYFCTCLSFCSQGGLAVCPGGGSRSLSRDASVPVGSLSGGGVYVPGVSVTGDLCLGVSVLGEWGLCSGGSLSRGVSVPGDINVFAII